MALSLAHAPFTPTHTQDFPLGGGAVLRLRTAPGVVSFQLEEPGRPRRALHLDARPGGPAVTHRWAPWSMKGRWGYGLRGEGPRALWKQVEAAARRHGGEPGAAALLRPASAAFSEALEQLKPSFDPAWVAEANRFEPGARWAVYRALASDGTGRLQQLAASAPGLLGLALAHARRADRAGACAAAQFLADVVSGTPLRKAAAPLLEDWWDHGARRRRWMDGQGPQPPIHSDEARRRMAEQWVLLRRAFACVPLDLLWRPAPLLFVPEDVPRGEDVRDQVRWFELMKARTLTLFPNGSELQAGTVAYLSQHAQSQLGRATERVDELWSWVRGTGRQLYRGMNGHAVHNAMARWHWERTGTFGDGGWDARVRRLAARHPHLACPGADGSTDLALLCLYERHEAEGFSLVPLYRASELRREGDEMGHCVASLLEEAATGRSFLHTVRVGEERLTLQVRGPAEAPTLGQYLGRQNREPSDAARTALEAWWEAVNVPDSRPSEETRCPATAG